jgi:hypothetical protein
MNLAWKVEATPWMYYAPMGPQTPYQRFADIWMGVYMKRAMDAMGKAVVSGYSWVHHTRASNVFINLEQEGPGIRVNETFWFQDEPVTGLPLALPDSPARDYFHDYRVHRERWQAITSELLGQ